MIKVTVELLVHGSPKNVQHLGTAYITNDETGDKTLGNYNVLFSRRDNAQLAWRTGHVKNFKRLQYGAWDLLALALISVLGPERLSKLVKRTAT